MWYAVIQRRLRESTCGYRREVLGRHLEQAALPLRIAPQALPKAEVRGRHRFHFGVPPLKRPKQTKNKQTKGKASRPAFGLSGEKMALLW